MRFINYQRLFDADVHGDDVLPEHCVIRHINGEVMLHPTPGAYVTVNDKRISMPVKLSQGAYFSTGSQMTVAS